jgi:hypothetical protein
MPSLHNHVQLQFQLRMSDADNFLVFLLFLPVDSTLWLWVRLESDASSCSNLLTMPPDDCLKTRHRFSHL